MDLNRKLDIAKTAIDSISRHDDADAIVRSRILDAIQAHIATERGCMRERLDAQLRAMNPTLALDPAAAE